MQVSAIVISSVTIEGGMTAADGVACSNHTYEDVDLKSSDAEVSAPEEQVYSSLCAHYFLSVVILICMKQWKLIVDMNGS